MAGVRVDTIEARCLLTELPRELLGLTLLWLDTATIAILSLCNKALRNAVRRGRKKGMLPPKQKISDFVRDPKLLALGLALFEFPCESLTRWAIRVGSVPTLDYLRQIGFLDAKIVCGAAVRRKDLAILEWSLLPDIRRYWASEDCRAAILGSAEVQAWVQKNGCPCLPHILLCIQNNRHASRAHEGVRASHRAAHAQLAACGHMLPSQRPTVGRPAPSRPRNTRQDLLESPEDEL